MSLISPKNDSPPKTHNSFIIHSLGVTIFAYPMLVLKTRRQVYSAHYPYLNMCRAIIRYEGFRGFYKGFGIFLLGYMSAQKISGTVFKFTKREFTNTNSVENGLPKQKTIAVANAAALVAAITAFHLVRIPVDVVSQRLMVQGNIVGGVKSIFANINYNNSGNYKNGYDVFRKIMRCDGPRGLYRGFGITILMQVISAWMPCSYYLVQKHKNEESNTNNEVSRFRNNGSMSVHFWMNAVVGTGVSAIVTTPLDTIRTRLQVLDAVEENGRRRPLTFMRTVRNLVNEGGALACYRGFGPRWASIFMSFTLISSITRSTKSEDKLN